MEQGVVKNLERIQEDDGPERAPRGAALALVAMGGACLVFAWLALGGRKSAAAPPQDPLGELVAQQRAKAGAAASSSARPSDLRPTDVTFPGILSDQGRPTTALAAVRGGALAAIDPSPAAPPPATDRLPVVPLPAQSVLDATPVTTRPRDALTKAASDSAQLAASTGPAAAAGHEGAYQLQVSSFRDKTESDQFAEQLRARGHRAYVVEAHVVGRGTWYRVRVGPFPTQQVAAAYRVAFEQKEQVVPFLIPPPPPSTASATPSAQSAASPAAPGASPKPARSRRGEPVERERNGDGPKGDR